MGRSSGLISTLLGLAAVVFAVLWLRREPAPAPPEAGRPPFVLPVTLAEVEVGSFQPRVDLTGSVKSPARAQLSFEQAGALVELAFREAESFQRGDELARLDDADQQLAVRRAEADAALAQRELDKLEAGTRAETLARILAEYEEAKVREELAQTEVERGLSLVADRVISEGEIDRLMTEESAAAARTAAKAAELEEARAGTREEDLAIARARVAQAQTQLAQAQRRLDQTRLIALSDGVVLSRRASVGDHVTIGVPVLEVVDLGDLEVQVDIPGRYAHGLPATPRVRLTADDLRGWSFETELSAKIPAASESSRNFIGLVRLERESPAHEALQPGMFVRVELDLRTLEGVAIVPADAVRRNPGSTEIARVVEGAGGPDGRPSLTAEVLQVEVLASHGGRSAVALLDSAIQLGAGERVVLSGVDRVFPGAPLLPAAPSAEEPKQ
jgi:RND family efflux transporter MFP subunit